MHQESGDTEKEEQSVSGADPLHTLLPGLACHADVLRDEGIITVRDLDHVVSAADLPIGLPSEVQ